MHQGRAVPPIPPPDQNVNLTNGKLDNEWRFSAGLPVAAFVCDLYEYDKKKSSPPHCLLVTR